VIVHPQTTNHRRQPHAGGLLAAFPFTEVIADYPACATALPIVLENLPSPEWSGLDGLVIRSPGADLVWAQAKVIAVAQDDEDEDDEDGDDEDDDEDDEEEDDEDEEDDGEEEEDDEDEEDEDDDEDDDEGNEEEDEEDDEDDGDED